MESSDIDLWNLDLLDTFRFVRYRYPHSFFISKTSWRCFQDMSSRRLQDMFSRHLQDIFSITIFRLPKRLQDVLWDVFKTSSGHLQDVFKTSWKTKIFTLKTCCRRLQDMSWRCLQDVLLEDQEMFAGTIPRCQWNKYEDWQQQHYTQKLTQKQWEQLFLSLFKNTKQKEAFDIQYKFLHFVQPSLTR